MSHESVLKMTVYMNFRVKQNLFLVHWISGYERKFLILMFGLFVAIEINVTGKAKTHWNKDDMSHDDIDYYGKEYYIQENIKLYGGKSYFLLYPRLTFCPFSTHLSVLFLMLKFSLQLLVTSACHKLNKDV